MVKSLFKHGGYANKLTHYSQFAAQHGFLEILMFLDKNGVELHENCFREANRYKKKGVVTFLTRRIKKIK